MPAPVTVTYYVEILSSWCHWAEPAWAQLKAHYGPQVEFQWRIALMRPADFPASAELCDWYYRRSGTHVGSPIKLNSGWVEPHRAGHYEAPNHVAEAGRDFLTPEDDTLRLALARAALLDGCQVGDLDTAVRIGANATGIDAEALRAAAVSPRVQDRVTASTAAFTAHQINQRPAFVITNCIGDKAVFAGLWRPEPLLATIDAMLADAARYASHAAHFGSPPGA